MDQRDRTIDEYDTTLTRVRKALTAAGIPEVEDGRVLPEDERVRRLSQGQGQAPAQGPEICAGCNVRGPWEHRCHGGGCGCADCATPAQAAETPGGREP